MCGGRHAARTSTTKNRRPVCGGRHAARTRLGLHRITQFYRALCIEPHENGSLSSLSTVWAASCNRGLQKSGKRISTQEWSSFPSKLLLFYMNNSERRPIRMRFCSIECDARRCLTKVALYVQMCILKDILRGSAVRVFVFEWGKLRLESKGSVPGQTILMVFLRARFCFLLLTRFQF